MHYRQIEEKHANSYVCPWRDKECLGTLCMAWVPSEHLDDFGRCGLVSGEED